MLDIIYQDNYLVAINKPAGLLVHRSLIDKHETQFAVQLLRDQLGQKVYPVHRLDKPTSGVLLFALNAEVARDLTTQFTAHTIQKQYLAIVRGFLPAQGVIDYPLTEEHDSIADAYAQPNKPAQTAITAYSCLATFELPLRADRYPTSRYSLAEIWPKTGRKHQIRRHFKHISHHLIGDTTHGNGKHNQLFRDYLQSTRLLLHAGALQCLHPINQKIITIHAPSPIDFQLVVQKLLKYK